MPSTFDTAIQAALGSVRSLAGASIVYTQGASQSAPITAGIGKTEYEIEDEDGILATWTARDYFVKASDLIVNGAAVIPQKGDLITEALGTFQVLAPDGKKVFEFSDRSQTCYRIHTKEVA